MQELESMKETNPFDAMVARFEVAAHKLGLDAGALSDFNYSGPGNHRCLAHPHG